MPALRQASENALPKELLRERLAKRVADEMKISGRADRQYLRELWRYRNGDLGISLLGLDGSNAVSDVLPTEHDGIATPQAGAYQDFEPYTLSRPYRPTPAIELNVGLSPRLEAVRLRHGGVTHA